MSICWMRTLVFTLTGTPNGISVCWMLTLVFTLWQKHQNGPLCVSGASKCPAGHCLSSPTSLRGSSTSPGSIWHSYTSSRPSLWKLSCCTCHNTVCLHNEDSGCCDCKWIWVGWNFCVCLCGEPLSWVNETEGCRISNNKYMHIFVYRSTFGNAHCVLVCSFLCVCACTCAHVWCMIQISVIHIWIHCSLCVCVCVCVSI